MINELLTFPEKQVDGPYTARGSHFFTTTGGRALLALPGFAFLYSIDISKAAGTATITVYNGIDTSGEVVAVVDASSIGTLKFGPLYCPKGIFLKVDTAFNTLSATIAYEGASPKMLTVSGNELTDSTRGAGLQGDGETPPAGYGIWEGTTNLCTNGGFETNSTGWVGAFGAVLSQDATTSKFGAGSLKIVGDGSHSDQGARFTTAGLTGSTTYTLSFWAKGTVGMQVEMNIGESFVSNAGALSAAWQRFVYTVTLPASPGSNFIYAQNANATAATWWVDGVQIEQKQVATPYVETNGGSASRSSSRVQSFASMLSATQGAVAVRLHMGYSAAGVPTTTPVVFGWKQDANNRIQLRFNPTGKVQLVFVDGVNSDTCEIDTTWSAGDLMTVVAAWTATTVKLSVNGSVFSSVSRTSTPLLLPQPFLDIGSDGSGASQVDCDVLWFASMVGTLTDTDAANLNTLGSTKPVFSNFPAAAMATMIWTAVTASYQTPF